MDLIADAVAAWNKGHPFSPPVTPAATSMGTAVQFAYPPAFVIAMWRLRKNEGGYVDNPSDPGGATNTGLSQRSYPTLDIKSLTDAQIDAIYYRDYWTTAHAPDMPSALGYQVFDFGVNSDPPVAIKHLQTVLGVTADGVWGPTTQAAAKAAPLLKTIVELSSARLDFLRSLSTWPTFGKGWSGRIALNLRYAALDT